MEKHKKIGAGVKYKSLVAALEPFIEDLPSKDDKSLVLTKLSGFCISDILEQVKTELKISREGE